jgi:triacylglycerol lipase
MTTSIIVLIIASTVTGPFWLYHLAHGQSSIANRALPVILIHGYFEDKSVWNHWLKLLQNKTRVITVTFNNTDDECGSAQEHAQELGKIIQEVKRQTGQDKVNIVGHSKGGLAGSTTIN